MYNYYIKLHIVGTFGLPKFLPAAPMAEWLRTLIFSAIACHLMAVGLSLAQVTYGTSQVLLAVGRVVKDANL